MCSAWLKSKNSEFLPCLQNFCQVFLSLVFKCSSILEFEPAGHIRTYIKHFHNVLFILFKISSYSYIHNLKDSSYYGVILKISSGSTSSRRGFRFSCSSQAIFNTPFETEIEIAESETSNKFYFPRNIEKNLPFKPY